MEITGTVIIWIGVVFILIGIVGIFRFNDFFARILITAKIDTVGVITLILGIVLKHGITFFSLKLLLLLVILLIVNPLSAHIIARAAYLSGYSPQKDMSDDGEDS